MNHLMHRNKGLKPGDPTRSKKEVLFVDDSFIEYELLLSSLDEGICDLEYACNSLEAQNKISTKQYDIIIIDIFLGNENGYKLFSEIKNNHSLKVITSESLSLYDELVLMDNAIALPKRELSSIIKNYKKIITYDE